MVQSIGGVSSIPVQPNQNFNTVLHFGWLAYLLILPMSVKRSHGWGTICVVSFLRPTRALHDKRLLIKQAFQAPPPPPVLMVVSPLWRGLGILGFTQDGGSCRPGRLLLTNTSQIHYNCFIRSFYDRCGGKATLLANKQTFDTNLGHFLYY